MLQAARFRVLYSGAISMSGFQIADVAIPDRPAFKASEVCEIAHLQPYVLRSWENEFPDLGVSRTPGGPRVYRKADVERVLQIRHLVLSEGLTLAGVRRKLEGAGPTPTPAAAAPPVPNDEDRALLREAMTPEIKARLGRVREGLRAVLELLSRDPQLPVTGDFHLEALAPATGAVPVSFTHLTLPTTSRV
jgi:DNA-binding transcriptional MerR regulator